MGIFGDWAVKYWEAGYSPVPIKPGSKGPANLAWQRFSNVARATEKELEELIEQFGHCGIGLCAGPATGLVFLDVDADQDTFPEFGNLVRSIIAPSPVERLGAKGFAAFYRVVGTMPSTGFDIRDDAGNSIRLFDIISGGRQLVIPPTIHPTTGKPYQWLTRENPLFVKQEDYPILTQEALDDLSDAAAQYAASKGFSAKRGKINLGGQFKSPDGERAPHGAQDRIKTLAVALIRNGASIDTAIRDLDRYDRQHHDKTYFNDPRGISDARYKDRVANIFQFYARLHKTMCDDAMSGRGEYPPKPASMQDFTTAVETPRIYKEAEEKGKKIITPLYHVFAEYIANKYHAYFESEKSGSAKFYYNGRFYQELYDGRVDRELLRCAGHELKPGHITGFHRITTVHINDREKPIEPINMINCANGIVSVSSKSIEPHSRDYAFHYCLDIGFDEKATCPRFFDFLDDVLEGDKQRIRQVQSFVGQTIMGGIPKDHRALVLYGTGFNGKSTLLNFIRALIGARNYSAISMGRLGDRFSTIGLKNKLANIVDETPAKDGIDSEIFKACVSGNVIRGEEKNRPAEEFRPTARFYFSCNEFPRFNDTSHGAERRLLIIPFEKRIKTKNPELEEYILTHEMGGVLNWALEGYQVFKNNNYTIPKSKAEETIMQEYREESNSVAAFFSSEIEVTNKEHDWITASEVYHRYTLFCGQRGLFDVNANTFAKRLSEEVKKNDSINYPSRKSDGKMIHPGLRIKGVSHAH